MNYSAETYDAYEQSFAIDASAAARTAFIQRTYLHVAGAIAAFALLLAGLYTLVPAQTMINIFGNAGMLVFLVVFIGGSYLSQYLVRADHSIPVQYMGLGLYIVLEALIFWPLLVVVQWKTGTLNVVYQAAILTGALAGGLTVAAFVTKKDFSFLGPIVGIGCLAALGLIIIAMIFGINLGLFFSFAMVALMSAAILYSASNVMYHYRTDQHVGAALYIFSAVMTLFYYIIRILMSSRD